jgi:hypothetical protein
LTKLWKKFERHFGQFFSQKLAIHKSNLGSMLWDRNFLRFSAKKWRFSRKPMLRSKFCIMPIFRRKYLKNHYIGPCSRTKLWPFRLISNMAPILNEVESLFVWTRVARWYTFKQKNLIWVKVLWAVIGRFWLILRPFGLSYGHWV